MVTATPSKPKPTSHAPNSKLAVSRPSERTALLYAVKNNILGLFALIVLVLEAILLLELVHAASMQERMTIAGLMIIAILVVVLCAFKLEQQKTTLEVSDKVRDIPVVPDHKRQELLDDNKSQVFGGNEQPLTPISQTNQLLQLRTVIYQAPRYSVPTYYLDPSLIVFHWNIAFEVIFQPILATIRRQHVNNFIVQLSNYDDVLNHAREFTNRTKQNGELPLVDCELLKYDSQTYGMVELEKVATQLTDSSGNLKAWAVALFPRRIDWDTYMSDLEPRLRDDKLWGIYAVSYDAILLQFQPYRELIATVVAGIPPSASRILELGAGTGNVTRALLQRGSRVTAVENNAFMLEKMAEKKLSASGRLTLLVESVEDTTFGDEANFDGAIAVNVMYALNDPAGCFRKVAAALRPGAVFALSTTHSGTTLDPLLKSIKEDLVAKGEFSSLEEHYKRLYDVNKDIEFKIARRYTLEEYRTMLHESGFEILYDRAAYCDAVQVIYARKLHQ